MEKYFYRINTPCNPLCYRHLWHTNMQQFSALCTMLHLWTGLDDCSWRKGIMLHAAAGQLKACRCRKVYINTIYVVSRFLWYLWILFSARSPPSLCYLISALHSLYRLNTPESLPWDYFTSEAGIITSPSPADLYYWTGLLHKLPRPILGRVLVVTNGRLENN